MDAVHWWRKKQDIHKAHQWFWVSFSMRSLRLSNQETNTVNMTWTDIRIATMLDCSEVMCQNVNPKYLISADQAYAGRWPLMVMTRAWWPTGAGTPRDQNCLASFLEVAGEETSMDNGQWTASLVTDRALSNLNLLLLHDCKALTTLNFELWTTLRQWELTCSRSLVAGIFSIAWIFLMFDVTNLFLPAS